MIKEFISATKTLVYNRISLSDFPSSSCPFLPELAGAGQAEGAPQVTEKKIVAAWSQQDADRGIAMQHETADQAGLKFSATPFMQ